MRNVWSRREVRGVAGRGGIWTMVWVGEGRRRIVREKYEVGEKLNH